MERLQKIIANSGYCSRRKAEDFIRAGKVKVNGEIVTNLGTKASSNDVITVCGNKLGYENKEYILLYKPRGVVTTTNDEKGRKTVLDIVETKNRLYPVGRLDYDTSGLLLLTNDGKLTNLLIHPSKEISKVYVAKIEGVFTKLEASKLLKGVFVSGDRLKADRIRIKKRNKERTIVEITIHSGKYHQIKNMFEGVGCKVIALKREKFAFLDLKGLKSGEYRYLSVKEVKTLYSLVK